MFQSAWFRLIALDKNNEQHIGMYVPQTNFNFQVFNLLAQVNYLGVRYDLHVPENLQAGDTFHVSVSLPPKLATWHVKKHVKNMLDISCVSEAKAKGMKIGMGNDGQLHHFWDFC